MKHRHSPLVRLLTLVLLATVLFARLAVAGYLCPSESGSMADLAAIADSAQCLDMDGAQPALCADHQQDGRHWADNNGHSPDAGFLPVTTRLLHILPPTPYAVRTPLPAYRPDAWPGPLYLATARLRI
ncbi:MULTISPECIES: hypothetical protein [Cupriavidus]